MSQTTLLTNNKHPTKPLIPQNNKTQHQTTTYN